jgi:hypothetical protein
MVGNVKDFITIATTPSRHSRYPEQIPKRHQLVKWGVVMVVRELFSPLLVLSFTCLLMACQGASSGAPAAAKGALNSPKVSQSVGTLSNTTPEESESTPQSSNALPAGSATTASTPTQETAGGDRSTSPSGSSATDSIGTPFSAQTLRWLNMGDFPSANTTSFSDCAVEENIQRSPCTTANARCRSKFATTCDAGSDCRRVFKCTTGQTNSLIWFPMGDGTTTASGLGICTMSENIAGSACSAANSRCLSSFCTSGSGEACGRRLFKCLTSGVPGKLYLRWMGDKPEAELAGIPQCAVTENIAGTECVAQNSNCVSSFYTDAPTNSKRRLFKCTP